MCACVHMYIHTYVRVCARVGLLNLISIGHMNVVVTTWGYSVYWKTCHWRNLPCSQSCWQPITLQLESLSTIHAGVLTCGSCASHHSYEEFVGTPCPSYPEDTCNQPLAPLPLNSPCLHQSWCLVYCVNVIDIPFGVEDAIVTSSQNYDQMWVSVIASECCE